MAKHIQVGEKVIGSTGHGRYGNRQVTGLYLGKDKDGFFMIAENPDMMSTHPCIFIRRFDDPFKRINWELSKDYIAECSNGLYKGGLL